MRPRGAREDFADLHAWAEVYIPGAGWIGLDPTSGLLAGEGHIPLAATPSPTSAAPITGTHGEGKVEFSATLAVTRLDEKPRVGRPYSEPRLAGDPRGRRRRGRAPRSRRRAPQHGRRADLRRPRGPRGARVEHRRARPDQARLRRQARAPPARALRPWRPAALRPGQVVSGRGGPALGLRHLLAHRRRAALAGPEPDRRRGRARCHDGRCPHFRRRACPHARPLRRQPHPRLRGCGPLHADRAEAAARRRAREQRPRRGSGAGAPDARLRPRPGQARRPRPAPACHARRRRQAPVRDGALGLPPRTPVPDPRQPARRPAPAARGPARDRLRRLSPRRAGRSLCRPARAARACTRARRASPLLRDRSRLQHGRAPARTHGARRRAARRAHLRVPAAARRRRGLRRS